MKTFETSVRVRYVETDAMGVTHHSNYLVWLEMARIEWLKSINLDYSIFEKNGYFLPVVEASLTYKKPTFFDDLLAIQITVPFLPKTRCVIMYNIIKDGAVVTTASTTHAFVNKDKKLVKPPEHFLSIISTWAKG